MVPDFFKKAIDQLGGTTLDGRPRYRVVRAEEQRWESGLLKDCPKYLWPDGRLMECWVLEVLYPPQYFGDPKDWNEAVCGEFPHRGFYGIKAPLVVPKGDELVILPLTESTLDSIRQKHIADLEWTQQNAADRLASIIQAQTDWQRRREESADANAEALMDEYRMNEEVLDAPDTRIYSMPKHLDVTTPGNKLPVGKVII